MEAVEDQVIRRGQINLRSGRGGRRRRFKQHEQDAAKASKPSKFPRLLFNFTSEPIAVLEMVDTLEFVTDEDMIAQYIASEEKRKKWFEEKGKDFVPDVPPDQLQLLQLLSYATCARIHSWTDDLDSVSVDAAVAAMFANDMGANAALMYDKMVKKKLSEAFSVQDEPDLITELVSVKLPICDETTIRDNVTQFCQCTEVMIIAKKLDQSPTPEAQENWITQLNHSVSKQAASTGLYMTNHTMDKHFTLAQWCKALVQRATQVMSAENAFKEWHKGRLSTAERQSLSWRCTGARRRTGQRPQQRRHPLRWSSSRTTMPPPPTPVSRQLSQVQTTWTSS